MRFNGSRCGLSLVTLLALSTPVFAQTAWQSEWSALSTALACTGGAAWSLREALDGLTVHPHPVEGEVDQAVVDELIDRALELT